MANHEEGVPIIAGDRVPHTQRNKTVALTETIEQAVIEILTEDHKQAQR